MEDCNCYSATKTSQIISYCYDFYDGERFSYDGKVLDKSEALSKCGNSYYCPSKYGITDNFNCTKISENSNLQHLYAYGEIIKLPCI